MKTIKPFKTNKLNGGVRKLFKFTNGYGASVVRHRFSYGNQVGKWELAVLQGPKHEICYTTPITDDVLGWLSNKDVQANLRAIKALPKLPT